MPSLEKPSPATIRRIYFALVRKPHSFEELVNVINIDKSMLGFALDFLKEKGMIISFNFGSGERFKMVRTQPLRYGWNFPWLDLMMSAENWKIQWKQVVYGKTGENASEEKLNTQFRKLLKDLLVEPSSDLIEVMEALGMTAISLEVFKLHNQEPYCLECLKKERQFVRMILCEKSEEHCCPNCGVVRETLLMKRR